MTIPGLRSEGTIVISLLHGIDQLYDDFHLVML